MRADRSHRRLRFRASVASAALALAVGVITLALGVWAGLESQSLAVRYRLRPTTHPKGVVVVGVDDPTLSSLHVQYPFSRAYDAVVVDRLHAAGARVIVFDEQFTQDFAGTLTLYNALGQAGGAILATTTSYHGHTDVFGGDANLVPIHSRAARGNVQTTGADVTGYDYSIDGIPTIGVAAAERYLGHPVSPARFGTSPALLDFAGPPGTFPSLSFGDVYSGSFNPASVRGKIVVIGATASVLLDLHSTPVGTDMAGPEIQATAIWSALHGNPLRNAPAWLTWLALIVAALITPLLAALLRLRNALLLSVLAAAGYALLCVFAFDHGMVLVAVAPLATWAVSFVATVASSSLAGEFAARALAALVRARDREIYDAELEIIYRLARASESRDEDTGDHVDRIRHLCERLARESGMPEEEARRLGYAAILHDIGKIGVPDSVLLKPGKLNDEEWVLMRAHTTIGADVLAGSDRPIIQLGEVIARTHHEKWDGNGYPAGLKGEDIPLAGRICALCDVFDALLSPRPYKEAWTAERTIAEIERSAGSHFDPDLAQVFLRIAPELAAGYKGMTAEPERPPEPRPTPGPALAPVRAQ